MGVRLQRHEISPEMVSAVEKSLRTPASDWGKVSPQDVIASVMNCAHDGNRKVIRGEGLSLTEAIRRCHVRSAVRQLSVPCKLYWKNNPEPIEDRVPPLAKQMNDWEEYDPREHEECSEYNETPA